MKIEDSVEKRAARDRKAADFGTSRGDSRGGVKSSTHDSAPLTASISLGPSESVLRSCLSLNRAAGCLRAGGESLHHLICLHLSNAWMAEHLHLQALHG